MSGEPSPKHLFDRKLKKNKQLNLKNKLSNKKIRDPSHGYGEHVDGCHVGEVVWGND